MRWEAPDSEQLLIDYLEQRMGIPWGDKASTASEFGKIIRTGGPRATPVSDKPQLTVELYAKLPSQAWNLTQQALGHLFDAPGLVMGQSLIYSVEEFAGPGKLPDPLLPEFARYTFTVAVQLRAKYV